MSSIGVCIGSTVLLISAILEIDSKFNLSYIDLKMDKIPESDQSQGQTAEVCNKNKNLPKNPFLYLFVQHVWDPRHGPCYDGREYKKLENWLETVEFVWYEPKNYMIFRNSEGSPFCTPMKPSSPISYEDFQRKTQQSRDMIILAQVADRLKSLMTFLNSGKGDVNYENCDRRTALAAYLYECRNISADAPEDQMSIIRKVIKGLIEIGTPLYTADCRGETPLFIATMCKNHQILQTIISCLPDVTECDKFGNTALHTILDNCVDKEGNHKDGYVDLVRTMVSKGANVNAKNSKGVTPVHLAAEKFQTEMLRFFADQGANFDAKTYDNETSLQFACKSTLDLKDSSKIIETFDFLLCQGCDVETVDKEVHTPMHFDAEFRCVEIVERLIALGVKVDCRTKKTRLTPLYLAAKGDKLDNMKALVRAGADVNAEAADGSTPIFMSAMMGSYDSMQFLMDQGAELYRRDSLLGFTLLHMTANGVELRDEYKAAAVTQTEDKLKKLKLLIDKGFDVNDEGFCSVTPLQLAILAPNLEAVKLLLDRGANVNFQNQWTALELALQTCDKQLACATRYRVQNAGRNRCIIVQTRLLSLHFIRLGVYPEDVEKDDVRLSCPIIKSWLREGRRCASQYLKIVSMLIAHGANVNVQSASGETPLHYVALHTDGALEKLLEAGAHVNVQDHEGRLPIHKVCKVWQRNNPENLKLLLDFGADVNDDDVSKLLVSKACKSREVVVHAIKRKLVGLAIAKVYESLILAPEFADFHEQCSKEVIKLKNHRDDDGFSLYEFLRMNPKFQYHYIYKISFDYKNLEELFPLYAGLIRAACRESAVRRQLLEPARIVWAENSGINLPEVCVENIISHLSNRYLTIMVSTSKEIRIRSVPDERAVFKYQFSN